jgi:hypothetical protein
MMNFHRLCLALALIVAFTVPAMAGGGDIDTPGLNGEISTPGASGDISTPGVSGDISTPGVSGDISTPGASGNFSTPSALNPGEITTSGFDLQSHAWGAWLWLMPKLAM